MMEIFSGDAIRVNLAYLDQLKHLFTRFIHSNFNEKIQQQWKDIEEKNSPMIARGFLKLCRYYDLIPNVLNIEDLAKYMEATLPPITNAEHEFYNNEKLTKIYDEDKNWQTPMAEPKFDQNGDLNEPALLFHEFLFLLGLIALRCMESS
jgi:hypothetical protein